MDAYDAARLIEEIGETSSRTEKERLTAILAESDIGKFILNWTYNPFITFGLTVAPTVSDSKYSISFKTELVEPLLKRLANRELTGNAAEREVAEVMQAFDPDGARLLYLILSKDLKCGIAQATINTVMPGLVPVFSVMRAHPYDVKKVKSWPQKGEYKLDGQRNTFLCQNDNGGFFTRSGKRVPQLDFLVPIVMKAANVAAVADSDLNQLMIDGDTSGLNFMLDGEAMMGLFEDIGALRRKETDAKGAELHLYDIMSYADFDATGSVGKPLHERRELLRKFVHIAKKVLGDDGDAIQMVPQFFINSDEEAQAFFEKTRAKTLASYLARGNPEREAELLEILIDKATGGPKVLEGAMIKDPNGLYDKKKSYGWMKIKAEETKDLRITGWFEGKEGSELEGKFGGYLVDHEGVEVRVGGGYSAPQREEALKDCLLLTADQEPVLQRGVKKRYFDGTLVEVEFNEVTPDGSLRHPRFVRYRQDKDGEIEDKEAA